MNDLSSRSLKRTLRYIDWGLLATSIGLGFIDGSYQHSAELNQRFFFFCLAVFLLSWITPLGRSHRGKYGYIVLNMAVIITSMALGSGSDLILYWLIIKIALILELWQAIVVVILAGFIHLTVQFYNYPYILELSSQAGFQLPENPRQILLASLTYYLGASGFCLLLSQLFLAERRSRHRAEQLAQEVEQLAATVERDRIARDIHDSLGHSLTTLDIHLELAQTLRDRDPTRALAALDQAKTLSKQCLEDVRRSVQSLRNPHFDLDQALRLLIDQQTIAIDANIDIPPIPRQTGHQLFCIIQEGLTNIQKHAKASHIQLHTWIKDDRIYLNLQDNGCGFDPQKPRTGYGLRGMEERIQLLGGNLTIYSKPGHTEIRGSIPCAIENGQ
jgi:signal transduction histidine kinase